MLFLTRRVIQVIHAFIGVGYNIELLRSSSMVTSSVNIEGVGVGIGMGVGKATCCGYL